MAARYTVAIANQTLPLHIYVVCLSPSLAFKSARTSVRRGLATQQMYPAHGRKHVCVSTFRPTALMYRIPLETAFPYKIHGVPTQTPNHMTRLHAVVLYHSSSSVVGHPTGQCTGHSSIGRINYSGGGSPLTVWSFASRRVRYRSIS